MIKLENGLKKLVRNFAGIEHGFVELFVILFTLNLSNQAVFSTFPKIQDKNLNILRTKRAFK